MTDSGAKREFRAELESLVGKKDYPINLGDMAKMLLDRFDEIFGGIDGRKD